MIELLLVAEQFIDDGAFDRAEHLYEQVAEADPRNAIAVAGLARVALARGDRDRALAEARRALLIDPEEVAAQRLIAHLEFAGTGEDLEAIGPDQAPDIVEAAAGTAPSDLPARAEVVTTATIVADEGTAKAQPEVEAAEVEASARAEAEAAAEVARTRAEAAAEVARAQATEDATRAQAEAEAAQAKKAADERLQAAAAEARAHAAAAEARAQAWARAQAEADEARAQAIANAHVAAAEARAQATAVAQAAAASRQAAPEPASAPPARRSFVDRLLGLFGIRR
ncbi:MAG: tetratricopeptide repeat protein [Chloroflexota bacterium]|nr:MAG: tetratricopeptide repeat protein [Chloroflexota bacterium]